MPLCYNKDSIKMSTSSNNTFPNILIAPDKFKGSLSAAEVAQAIARGIQQSYPLAHCILHPMADGGDGSLSILTDFLNGEIITVDSLDPLGRPIKASYLLVDKKAFIELAAASGIVLLEETERNPLLTSTRGTGLLMKDALTRGAEQLFLFAGGSATNEAGIGIAHGLGFRFLDQDHKELEPIGENLIRIAAIKAPKEFPSFSLIVLSDVTNPLYGPNGAAQVYARQKGADADAIAWLENGLIHFANLVKGQFAISIETLEGGGCAGGVGAGCVALLGASIQNGFEALSQMTGLELRIQAADLVITGEGRMDTQSLQGKVVGSIAALCRMHQKRCMAVVGVNDLSEAKLEILGLDEVYAIMNVARDEQDAMANGAGYLEVLGRELGKALKLDLADAAQEE
jgi:glycerate 2-kinase